MVGISPYKIVNVSQALRKRLSGAFQSRRVQKAKARRPESMDLCPLFPISLPGNPKCSPHPTKSFTTFRAFGCGTVGKFPRLSTCKTGMRPEALRASMPRRYGTCRNNPVPHLAPNFHALYFRGANHAWIMRSKLDVCNGPRPCSEGPYFRCVRRCAPCSNAGRMDCRDTKRKKSASIDNAIDLAPTPR